MLENRLLTPSFDLQMFAEGEAVVAETVQAESVSTDVTPEAVTESNPLLDYLQGNEPSETKMTNVEAEVVTEEPVAQTENELIAQALQETGALKKFGGDPQKLIDSYKSAEGELTRRSMELSEVRKQAEAYKQQLAEYEARQALPQAEPEAPPVQLSPEEFLEKFYENPTGAIEALVEKGVAEKTAQANEFVQKLQAERQYEVVLNDATKFAESFSDQHPDMAEIAEEMNAYMDSLPPHLANRPPNELIEEAYYVTKGKNTPSIDELLSNPTEDLVNKIASSPLKDQIVAMHMASVKNSQQGLPNTIGSGSGGVSTVASPEKAKSFEEAGRAFLASLGR